MEKKGRVILINYANDAYRKSQKVNTWTGKHLAGFKNVIEYCPKNIDKKFYEKNKRILETKRGNGLWLWKPYFIYKTLQEVDYGDIVFYCDSGACFFRSVKPILKILDKQDIWVTILPLIEKQFTKKETFKIMNLQGPKYEDSNQVSGTFIAVRKTKKSMDFIKEWLEYCEVYENISPSDNINNEISNFIGHREDQSILSLLVKKYGISYYSDPSQFGKLPEKYKKGPYIMNYYKKKDYPYCIIHHRTKNARFKELLKQWLLMKLPKKFSINYMKKRNEIID